MSRPPTPLSQAIRRARRAAGLSQGALGASIGRDRHRVARIEAGAAPTDAELVGLSRALSLESSSLHGAAFLAELDALFAHVDRIRAARDAILQASPDPDRSSRRDTRARPPGQLSLDLE